MFRLAPLEIISGITAVVVPLVLGIFILRYTVEVPFWDEFEYPAMILQLHNGTLTFQELWAQHNDHRVIFGRLIALALASAGGWSEVRECLASLAVAVIGQLFLLGLLRRTFATRTAIVLLVPDSFLLFALSQWGNWTWGFQTVWFLVNTCLFAALYFVTDPRAWLRRLAVAAAFAYVASFSLSFGLNVWPAGATALLFSRPFRGRLLCAWILLACVAIVLYFYHYDTLWQGSAGGVHATFPELVVYFLAYLGAALGGWAGVTTAAILGALGLAAYLAAAGALLLRRISSAAAASAAVWIGVGSFAIFCAALTTFGRAGLGIGQALESRYITPSTTLWISLISLAVLASEAESFGPAARRALGLSFVAGAALFCLSSYYGYRNMRTVYAERLRYYEIARNVATATDDQLLRLFPSAPAARAFSKGCEISVKDPRLDDRGEGAQPSADNRIGLCTRIEDETWRPWIPVLERPLRVSFRTDPGR